MAAKGDIDGHAVCVRGQSDAASSFSPLHDEVLLLMSRFFDEIVHDGDSVLASSRFVKLLRDNGPPELRDNLKLQLAVCEQINTSKSGTISREEFCQSIESVKDSCFIEWLRKFDFQLHVTHLFSLTDASNLNNFCTSSTFPSSFS